MYIRRTETWCYEFLWNEAEWSLQIFLMLLLSSSECGHENSGLNEDSNPDLCDAGAVLYQLSFQANWEQIIMWVDYELWDDGDRSAYMMNSRLKAQQQWSFVRKTKCQNKENIGRQSLPGSCTFLWNKLLRSARDTTNLQIL